MQRYAESEGFVGVVQFLCYMCINNMHNLFSATPSSNNSNVSNGDNVLVFLILTSLPPPLSPFLSVLLLVYAYITLVLLSTADTVIGDPLFTVPIVGNEVSEHLCYEIRGMESEYFNFISDSCVSVNAHYISRSLIGKPGLRPLHVIDEIAIRAVSNASSCVNIDVSRTGCTATLDGVAVSTEQSIDGITVTVNDQHIHINVPNCDDIDLEMEVVCEQIRGVEMLRFEVVRGTNLRESSHGLIGKYSYTCISSF